MNKETLTPEQIKEEREALERVVDQAVARVEQLRKICPHPDMQFMTMPFTITELRKYSLCPHCGFTDTSMLKSEAPL